MASRTQLRLGQITGSFGTGAINDQINAAATGSIATTDLQGVLSHLAGAIKRIHGEDSFSQNAAGEFAVTLQPSTDDGAALGGASNNWSDLYLADGAVINLGDDQDVKLTHVADTGILLTGTGLNQLAFRDADLVISSSADGTLDIEADTQINIGTDRSGIAISLGHTTSEVTVNDNLTVTGDLTVNGATTTIDTTNLLVEDVVIGMAANAASQNQNGGLAIFSGSSDSDLVFGRVADDVWGLGKKATLKGTVTDLSDMTLVNARAARYEVDGANDYLDVVSSDLTAVAAANFKVDAATDIYLDADGGDIFLQNAGSTFLQLQDDPNGEGYAVLSSSAGKNLALVDNSGIIGFWKDDATDGNINMSIFLDDSATPNLVKFLVDDQNARLTLSAGYNNEISGSLLIDGGGEPGALRLKESGAVNNNYVELNVPTSLGANLQLTLPGSDGSNGQVLKTDGNGVLSFGDATGDLARSAYKVTAQITSADLDFSSSGDVTLLSSAGYSSLNITKSDASLPEALEVFVNGQLLVSGSDGGTDTDYTHKGSTTLKFAFNLEADDIVQIIQR